MKHTPWIALTLVAGVFTTACAQLEDQYDKDWGTRKPVEASAENSTQAGDDAGQIAQIVDTSEDAETSANDNSPPPPAPAVDLEYKETSQALPTGKRSNSALMLEKSMPTEVWKDVEFEYSLTVENLTKEDLDNVFVEERLPTSMRALSSQPEAMSNEGGKLLWNVGSLAGGASTTIQVTAIATADGLSESFALATYDRALQGQVLVVSPKVNLSLTGPDSVAPGDEFDLHFTLNYTGTGAARNVAEQANLPDGLQTLDGKTTATFQVPKLAAGESRTLALQATATRAGDFTPAAEASLHGGAKVTATAASIAVQETKLSLNCKAPSKFFLGAEGKVEYTIRNTGQTVASDVQLTQPIHEGVELVRSSLPANASGGENTWMIGDLAAGETKVITVHLMASESGQLNLGASAKASKGSASECTSEISMEGLAALHFSMEDLQDPVPVGESLTYHVKVHNQGTAAGGNISVKITLEDGMELVRAAGPTNGKADGNLITFQPLETLAPDATATWRLVIKSRKVGDLRLGAALTSNRLKRPVEVNESTQFYE